VHVPFLPDKQCYTHTHTHTQKYNTYCHLIRTLFLRVSEQRNILHEIRTWKANWIGHILRRNCLLKQVIGGKIKGRIEVTRRRGRRRKQLLDDLGDRRGYCHLKGEALDRIKWRNRFGRGCGPVVCLTDYWWMNVALVVLQGDSLSLYHGIQERELHSGQNERNVV
jgi:hypothetical protein